MGERRTGGTQAEYDAFLEEERDRIDNDPQLVAFMEHLKSVEKEVDADLGEVGVGEGRKG